MSGPGRCWRRRRGRGRASPLSASGRIPTVLVTVYGSAEDVRDALGTDAATARLVFFSHPSLRVADEDWPIYDVASWARGCATRDSMDDVLTHELAHAYTVQLVRRRSRSRSSLLVEGIAQAAEGMPVVAVAARGGRDR